MAYFAKLDANNVVDSVIVVGDEFAPTEQDGANWLNELYGEVSNWKQGYLDGRRYNLPCQGFTYDPVADAFIPAKPYNSWILNTATYQWEAPVPYPVDDHVYRWDEATQSWVDVKGA